MSFNSNVCKKMSYSIKDLTVRKKDLEINVELMKNVDFFLKSKV